MIEADQFFVSDGEYRYDRSKIKDAHAWSQSETRKRLVRGEKAVVANTFCKKWEMKFYLDLAKELNVPHKIVIATGRFANVHSVSSEIVDRQRAKFEM